MAYDGGSSVRRRRRGNGFSDMSPFLGGALGLLYKPRTAVLYQDAFGSLAVSAAADPVGLQMDDSKGRVLGSELVANGNFAAGGTNWGLGAGWDASSGAAVQTGAVSTNLTQNVIAAGKSYLISWDQSGSQVVAVYIDGVGINISNNSANKTYSFIVYSVAGGNLTFRTGATGATIDNVSVKELPGNHAALSGSNTLRPLYQVTPQRLVFDGVDDRLLTALNPTTAGTIAVRMRGTTASRVAIGSQGATNGRAFIALAADGSLAAGIGADSTSTIKGTTDKRNVWVTGHLMWDGSAVTLYEDGLQVYSAAQNGAVNTTVPWMLGCLNNNATAASFWGGDIGAVEILNRVMTPTEVQSHTNLWSTIQ